MTQQLNNLMQEQHLEEINSDLAVCSPPDDLPEYVDMSQLSPYSEAFCDTEIDLTIVSRPIYCVAEGDKE